MRRLTVLAACVLILLAASAAPASAQVVNPPASVQFDHADFTSAVSYQVGYYMLTVTAGVCNGYNHGMFDSTIDQT